MEKNDHDLLIEIATTVNIVQTNQINHLEHHRKRDLTMLSVTLGAVFTALLAIIGGILAVVL